MSNPNFKPRWASQNKVPRMFILEGPDHEKLTGWRHYQIVQDGRRSTVMSKPFGEHEAHDKYGAKFFARGTWEDATKSVAVDTMPVPKPEIFQEIYGVPIQEKQQLDFA